MWGDGRMPELHGGFRTCLEGLFLEKTVASSVLQVLSWWAVANRRRAKLFGEPPQTTPHLKNLQSNRNFKHSHQKPQNHRANFSAKLLVLSHCKASTKTLLSVPHPQISLYFKTTNALWFSASFVSKTLYLHGRADWSKSMCETTISVHLRS